MLRTLLCCLVVAAGSVPACAGELVGSLYGGRARIDATDVTLHRSDGTELRFGDVAFDDESSRAPIYWGARLTWWSGRAHAEPGWGLALDFTHAKASADTGQRVHVSGTRGGVAVDTEEPLGNTFGQLVFTHGLNLLTLNALYRWRVWDRLEIRPYAGAGLGIAVPHVEVETAAGSTRRYSVTGAAYQGLAGLDFRLSARFSLFAEYKLSRAEIDADIAGGSVKLKPWIKQAVAGVGYRF